MRGEQEGPEFLTSSPRAWAELAQSQRPYSRHIGQLTANKHTGSSGQICTNDAGWIEMSLSVQTHMEHGDVDSGRRQRKPVQICLLRNSDPQNENVYRGLLADVNVAHTSQLMFVQYSVPGAYFARFCSANWQLPRLLMRHRSTPRDTNSVRYGTGPQTWPSWSDCLVRLKKSI